MRAKSLCSYCIRGAVGQRNSRCRDRRFFFGRSPLGSPLGEEACARYRLILLAGAALPAEPAFAADRLKSGLHPVGVPAGNTRRFASAKDRHVTILLHDSK